MLGFDMVVWYNLNVLKVFSLEGNIMDDVKALLSEVVSAGLQDGLTVEEVVDSIVSSEVLDVVRRDENRKVLEALMEEGVIIHLSASKGFYYSIGENRFTPLISDVFASSKGVYMLNHDEEQRF